jgi:hypothetical protein
MFPKDVFRFGRAALLAAALAAVPSGLRAQVDQSELGQDLGSVDFINYSGPHAVLDTWEQIRAIGTGLGAAVRDGAAEAGGARRYFVIHSVTEGESGKLDADIFGLGVDVGVDHIRNLRLIIQGYLETAYGYTASDAALLANYITIYNAVYRGDWDYFAGRYKAAVMEHQTPEQAGLSIRFDEWPGRTLLFIPLGSAQSGSLSAVDSSAVTGDRVIEELRKDDDRGIPQREEMAALKEREAADAAGKAQVQKEAAKEEEQKAAEKRDEASQTRREIAAAQDGAPEEAARKQEEAAKQEEEAAKQEEAAREMREEARQQEDLAAQKQEEARQEREGIAQDKAALAAAAPPQTPQAAAKSVLAARLLREDSPLGQLVEVDAASKRELRHSETNTLNLRTIAFVGGKIIAIAGENRGSGAVRLVEIARDTLAMTKQGEDDIAPQSLLWVNGGSLYAVVSADGGFYLARFDTGLALQARSQKPVHPYAAALFDGGALLTQSADGSALVLDPGTLAEK